MSAPHAPRRVERQVLRIARERGSEGGEFEEIEWLAGPGWSPLPSRRHDVDERLEILSGRVRVVVDGVGRTYRAGESVIVAAGRPHALQPVDDHGIHVRVQRWTSRGEPA
jgi:mannose-6-phosphate isomerase-like protein (cupin superfamily)